MESSFVAKVKVKVKVSAGFHSLHFYSATIAAKAFRALRVGYAATREKIATPRIEPGPVVS